MAEQSGEPSTSQSLSSELESMTGPVPQGEAEEAAAARTVTPPAPAQQKRNDWWSRLSSRERLLVGGCLLVFFVLAGLLLSSKRSQRLDALHAEIDELEHAVRLVRSEGALYKQRLAEQQQRESRIADTPVSFANIIAIAGQASGVSMTNDDEPPPQEVAEGLTKREVLFDLRNVQLEPLSKFLQSIESTKGRIVLTESLLIRSPRPTEDRLNVNVSVATWERKAEETADKNK